MKFRSLQGIALALMLTATPLVGAQEGTRIGFVNLDRILREATPAKAAQKKIESEFTKRDQDLKKLAEQLKGMEEAVERNAMTMPDSERSKRERELAETRREFQRKQREFREDFNQRRNEELSSVLERANRAVKQVAEAEKIDIIFQEAVYASARIDITERVIKALEETKPAGK